MLLAESTRLLSLLLCCEGEHWGGGKGQDCPSRTPEFLVLLKRFASTNANTEGLLSDWPSLGCLSMGTPTYSIQPRTPFLPSMRFFETLENEGEFMPKNKRLVKLHVLFDRHFRRASHSAGGDWESATQKQLLWDGTCLVRSASMTLRLH